MSNSLMVIAPYVFYGTWVFDDEATGLVHEPFIEGIPEMIEKLVADIPDARTGFRLTFSALPFPGAQAHLEWVREDMGGNWYHSDLTGAEGWLCPALFKYFESAPAQIFLKAEPLGQGQTS